MELSVTAIVVKSNDYKESDKLLKLFTLDYGIITAVIKGVKKPKAKLKFAAQIFSFCEYTLNEKNGFYTVTGATEQESLYGLSYDPDKYALASVILEVAAAAVSNLPSPALFVYMLKIFKALAYEDKDPYFLTALFISAALKNAGYEDKNVDLNIAGAPAKTDGGYITNYKKSVNEFEKRLGVQLVSAKCIV